MKSIWKRKVRQNSKERFIGVPKALDIPREVYLVLNDGKLMILTEEQAAELGILKNFENRGDG